MRLLEHLTAFRVWYKQMPAWSVETRGVLSPTFIVGVRGVIRLVASVHDMSTPPPYTSRPHHDRFIDVVRYLSRRGLSV